MRTKTLAHPVEDPDGVPLGNMSRRPEAALETFDVDPREVLVAILEVCPVGFVEGQAACQSPGRAGCFAEALNLLLFFGRESSGRTGHGVLAAVRR